MYVRIKESMFSAVERIQQEKKKRGSKSKRKGAEKEHRSFRNDSIIESREVVHGRRNISIALSLRIDTKEARGGSERGDGTKRAYRQHSRQPFQVLLFSIFSRTYRLFIMQKKKELEVEKKTNSYDIYLYESHGRTEGKINLKDRAFAVGDLTIIAWLFSRGDVQTYGATIAAIHD